MSGLTRLRRLVRNLLSRDRVERQLDDEIAHAVDALTDEKVAAGLARPDARPWNVDDRSRNATPPMRHLSF